MHLLKVGRGDPFSPASVSLKYSTMYETKYYNAHDDSDDADANYVVVRVMTKICYRWTNRMDGGAHFSQTKRLPVIIDQIIPQEDTR